MQARAPEFEDEPAAQLVQADEPELSEKAPGGQDWQDGAAAAPEANRPAAQLVQTEERTALAIELYRPGAQKVQAAPPAAVR